MGGGRVVRDASSLWRRQVWWCGSCRIYKYMNVHEYIYMLFLSRVGRRCVGVVVRIGGVCIVGVAW